MQYLDESGNVLYEVNDSDKIFKMVNGKISGLAGVGTRMVVADSSGNLSTNNTNIKNVKFYGAVGNGVVDDTSALSSIIYSLQEGDTLYFPYGTYKISDTLNFSGKENIKIISDGGSILNNINNNAQNMLNIQNCNNLKIQGLIFDINLLDSLSCLGIFGTMKGLNILECKFINFKNHAQFGIKLENIGADPSNYYTPTYTISRCDFYNPNSTSYAAVNYDDNKSKGTGIFLSNWSEYGSITNCNFFRLSSAILNDGGANTVITSNNFYLCGQKPSIYNLGSVIYMRNIAGNYSKNIISNNNFNHNYYYCIYYANSEQVMTISNNNFIVNLYTTLGLVKIKDSKIQNNYFEICNNFAGATNYPAPNTGDCSYIVLYDSSRNLISGNIFKDNSGAKNAIESLSLSTKNTVLNNTYQSLSVFLNLSGINNIANNYDVT